MKCPRCKVAKLKKDYAIQPTDDPEFALEEPFFWCPKCEMCFDEEDLTE